MASYRSRANKMRKEGAKAEIVGFATKGFRKMGEENPKEVEKPAAKVTAVIIGWYCRECTALHKPTEACPVTNLRMEAGIYDYL